MRDFRMDLPSDVLYILDRMKASGYTAHVVGGSVRDSMLGRPLGDFDITTNALPNETKAVFVGERIIETGIKHGTVTLVLGGVPYEITTYRVDGEYADNRHPDSVTFTDRLVEDLMRRDFTVNAMAYNPEMGLYDPYDGTSDAEARTIRAVGDPYLRFSEDALRILRALRFASVLGFMIEERTAEAARDKAHLVDGVSRERIYVELKKLVMGVDATRVLTEYSELLAPSLSGLLVRSTPDEGLLAKTDFCTRFASLYLINSHDPATHAEEALTALRSDKLTRTRVKTMLEGYNRVELTDKRSVLLALSRLGEGAVRDVLGLGILMKRYGDAETSLVDEAIASGVPYTLSALALSGKDVASLGFRGEMIGAKLKELLEAVINGEVENEKESLLAYIGN